MSRTKKPEARARELHDLATRGIPLSVDQQAELDAWYAAEDLSEGLLLSRSTPDPVLARLRAQVEETLARVGTATRQIEELAGQNEALRQEIAGLQQRVAQMPVSSAR